jgi:membrane protease YdiL (CAAX protease family)
MKGENLMTTVKKFVKSYPVLTYFALTFIFTWGCMALAAYPGGFPITEEQLETSGALVYMAMLAGPSGAGILLTGLLDGRSGFRNLFSRLIKWRVGLHWYAVALLTAPLLISTILLGLSLFSAEIQPAIFTSAVEPAVILSAVVVGLFVGLFEELGWTGFAVPRLRPRYGILNSGLIVGIVWGAWHFPPFWESDTFSGAIPFFLLILRLFAWLPPYRVLMVWVYDHTESLFVSVLMHASLVASLTVFVPADLTGKTLTIWILAWAVVLWIVVAAMAISNGWRIRQSSQRQVA